MIKNVVGSCVRLVIVNLVGVGAWCLIWFWRVWSSYIEWYFGTCSYFIYLSVAFFKKPLQSVAEIAQS